ncbi:MAG TPA: hypothetical protein PKC91_15545 [Ignavibacteria bacterium]|nr:hypothetical protein [Ignavibacteria bacterium]
MPYRKEKDSQKVIQALPESILDFQFKEIKLKEMEIELKKKQADNNYEFAKESLKFQSEDQKELRKQELSRERTEIITIFFSVLILFAFFTVAMLLNKEEILSDMMKALGYLFGGGITGYGIGMKKLKTRIRKEEKSES